MPTSFPYQYLQNLLHLIAGFRDQVKASCHTYTFHLLDTLTCMVCVLIHKPCLRSLETRTEANNTKHNKTKHANTNQNKQTNKQTNKRHNTKTLFLNSCYLYQLPQNSGMLFFVGVFGVVFSWLLFFRSAFVQIFDFFESFGIP